MMKVAMCAIASLIALGSVTALAQQPPAAKQDRAAIRAQCAQEAKGKRFGIRFIKRKRFIDDCVKRRPAR